MILDLENEGDKQRVNEVNGKRLVLAVVVDLQISFSLLLSFFLLHHVQPSSFVSIFHQHRLNLDREEQWL